MEQAQFENIKKQLRDITEQDEIGTLYSEVGFDGLMFAIADLCFDYYRDDEFRKHHPEEAEAWAQAGKTMLHVLPRLCDPKRDWTIEFK